MNYSGNGAFNGSTHLSNPCEQQISAILELRVHPGQN